MNEINIHLEILVKWLSKVGVLSLKYVTFHTFRNKTFPANILNFLIWLKGRLYVHISQLSFLKNTQLRIMLSFHQPLSSKNSEKISGSRRTIIKENSRITENIYTTENNNMRVRFGIIYLLKTGCNTS